MIAGLVGPVVAGLIVLAPVAASAQTIPLPSVAGETGDGAKAEKGPPGSRLCGDTDRLTPSDDSRLLPDSGTCAPSVVTVPSAPGPRRSLTGGGSRLGGSGSRLQ